MMMDPRAVDAGEALATSGLVHRVWQPDRPGPYRTVVMLHGRSGNENVMWLFARTLPADWLVVAPRGIKPDPSGGYAWHPRQRNEWPTLPQFDEAVAAITRFIQALPQLYAADLDHIYLMGFSQGAATAYATAIRHPGLIQGIAGLVGFIPVDCDTALESSPLKNLPIFMAVGKKDALIPLNHTAGCARTLAMGGTQLEYHEYDTGHKLNGQAMRDLKRWWRARAENS